MCFNKIIILLFLVVALNNRLILAENSEKQTLKNQKEKDSDTNVSQEDWEIIKDLEMLENLDIFQSEDIDLLKDYDMVDENINNEVKTDE